MNSNSYVVDLVIEEDGGLGLGDGGDNGFKTIDEEETEEKQSNVVQLDDDFDFVEWRA